MLNLLFGALSAPSSVAMTELVLRSGECGRGDSNLRDATEDVLNLLLKRIRNDPKFKAIRVR